MIILLPNPRKLLEMVLELLRTPRKINVFFQEVVLSKLLVMNNSLNLLEQALLEKLSLVLLHMLMLLWLSQEHLLKTQVSMPKIPSLNVKKHTSKTSKLMVLIVLLVTHFHPQLPTYGTTTWSNVNS